MKLLKNTIKGSIVFESTPEYYLVGDGIEDRLFIASHRSESMIFGIVLNTPYGSLATIHHLRGEGKMFNMFSSITPLNGEFKEIKTMTFKDLLKAYTDAEGWVLPKEWGGTSNETGNALLYTGIAYHMLHKLGELKSEDTVKFHSLVYSCYVENYIGLLHRAPGGFGGLEAHDDYMGVALASQPLAQQILTYGENNKWIFNNLNPSSLNPRSCFARFPEFVAHIQRSAGKKASIFLELVEFAKAAIGTVGNSSGDVLAWCRYETANSFLSKQAKKIFEKKIIKHYGSMREMFEKEFGEYHPFSQYFNF